MRGTGSPGGEEERGEQKDKEEEGTGAGGAGAGEEDREAGRAELRTRSQVKRGGVTFVVDRHPGLASSLGWWGGRWRRALTRSGWSSTSGEGQEVKLSLGVVLGLGHDESLWYRLSGDPGPNKRGTCQPRNTDHFVMDPRQGRIFWREVF